MMRSSGSSLPRQSVETRTTRTSHYTPHTQLPPSMNRVSEMRLQLHRMQQPTNNIGDSNNVTHSPTNRICAVHSLVHALHSTSQPAVYGQLMVRKRRGEVLVWSAVGEADWSSRPSLGRLSSHCGCWRRRRRRRRSGGRWGVRCAGAADEWAACWRREWSATGAEAEAGRLQRT